MALAFVPYEAPTHTPSKWTLPFVAFVLANRHRYACISSRAQALRMAARSALVARERFADPYERRHASGDGAVFVPARWRRVYMREFIRVALGNEPGVVYPLRVTWYE